MPWRNRGGAEGVRATKSGPTKGPLSRSVGRGGTTKAAYRRAVLRPGIHNRGTNTRIAIVRTLPKMLPIRMPSQNPVQNLSPIKRTVLDTLLGSHRLGA
jgi:hypothetical protein